MGSVMASQFPLSANAYYGVDDTIRVGLVGCGGRGTGAVLQAISAARNVKVTSMADAFMDRIEESLETLSNPESSGDAIADVKNQLDVPVERRFDGFDGYKEVIAHSDMVILTTPPAFRPMHFEAAVAAGKQVFMEKPLATDAPGIRRIFETAKKAREQRLNVVVGLQRHYQTIYRNWVERLHNGAIGDIVLGRVYWNSGGVWVRERSQLEKEAARKLTEMEYQMRNWYYFNWLCGDHIVEQHIHNIDVANWVKRGHPVRAQGQGGRLVRTGKDHGEIFDHHYVEFEYEDGSRAVSQCRHMPDCQYAVTEAFHGTHGTAPAPGKLVDTHGDTIMDHDDENDPNPYQVEHDKLFAAINAGEYKFDDTENGAIATMSAIMGRMATYSGQDISWEDALASDLALVPDTFSWDADPPSLPNAEGNYAVPVPGVTRVM